MKVQIGIFECTGLMGQDLVHPYIQSTPVLCDTYLKFGLMIWQKPVLVFIVVVVVLQFESQEIQILNR